MNAFNAQQMADDECGLLESCDECNKLIHNWDCMSMSFVTEDSRIVCGFCRTELFKKSLDK